MVVPLAVALILQKPLALPGHAMRLDALCKEISAQTGETNRATGAMAGRIVFAGGPPLRVETLRRDLAKAVWGIWRRDGSDWILEENLDAIKERAQTRLEKRIEVIGKAQQAMLDKTQTAFGETEAKNLRERLAKTDEIIEKDPNRGYAAWETATDAMPSATALRRVIANLNTKELAALEGIVVYSDQPTRLQKALPSSVRDAIRTFERDQSVWANTNTQGDNRSPDRGVRTMDPRNYVDPMAPGTLRLVLRVEEDPSGTELRFTANFVDKMLRVRQFAELAIPMTGTWRTPGEAPKASSEEGPLELSAESLEHARALKRGASGSMLPLVTAPDRRDPLDFTIAEVCRGLAQTRKTAVVAWLPDTLLQVEADFAAKPEIALPRPSEWVQKFWVRSIDPIPTADSLILRPRSIPINVDRRNLAVLLQATRRDGFPSLDTISNYAATRNDAYIDDLCRNSLNAVVAGSGDMIRADWRTLALWGIFTVPQRHAFLQRTTLPWSNFSPAQGDKLLRSILNAPRSEIRNTAPRTRGLTLYDEPTELLANGFATDGSITGIGQITEGVLLRTPDDDPAYAGFATAPSLAASIVRRERRPGENPYDGLPETLPTAYAPGRNIDFGFSMTLAPDVIWVKSGQHREFNLANPPVGIEGLPIAFRTEYGRQLDALRKPGP